MRTVVSPNPGCTRQPPRLHERTRIHVSLCFPVVAPPRAPEVYVRSGQGWRGLMRFRRQSESAPRPPEVVEDEQNRHILAACASDIIAFWQHPKVQRIMEDRKIGLRGEPGLYVPIQLLVCFPLISYFSSFLDDVERIAAADYRPTPGADSRSSCFALVPYIDHR